MSYPREQALVLSFGKVDIENTGANVAAIVVPCKCRVKRAVCSSVTAAANSFTVSIDSLSAGTAGAADIASIVVPDSAAAGAGYFDEVGEGVVLDAGDMLLLQVDEGGDAGEFAAVSVLAFYEAEVDGNESNLTETA